MLELHLQHLVRALASLSRVNHSMALAEERGDNTEMKGFAVDMREVLSDVKDELNRLPVGLVIRSKAEDLCARFAEEDAYRAVKFNAISVMDFEKEVRIDLSQHRFFVLPAERVSYYEGKNLFGDDVATQFPNAADDIEEAGKCLAVERPTAAVFHLMRVLEFGLQTLGARLGLTPDQIQDKTWQNIINNVRGAVNKLPETTSAEKEIRGKHSEIVAHLQSVKEAWRNNVMHPKASYSPAQALEIFINAQTLMRSIQVVVA